MSQCQEDNSQVHNVLSFKYYGDQQNYTFWKAQNMRILKIDAQISCMTVKYNS